MLSSAFWSQGNLKAHLLRCKQQLCWLVLQIRIESEITLSIVFKCHDSVAALLVVWSTNAPWVCTVTWWKSCRSVAAVISDSSLGSILYTLCTCPLDPVASGESSRKTRKTLWRHHTLYVACVAPGVSWLSLPTLPGICWACKNGMGLSFTDLSASYNTTAVSDGKLGFCRPFHSFCARLPVLSRTPPCPPQPLHPVHLLPARLLPSSGNYAGMHMSFNIKRHINTCKFL